MNGKKQKKEVDYTEPKETPKEHKVQAKPEVVDFSIQAPERETLRNLAELVGKTVVIHGYETTNTRLGPRTVVTVEYEGKLERVYTYSQVIADQLRRYKDVLDQGKALRAKVERRKRYLTLAPP